MTSQIPIPGVKHGERSILTVIDERAKQAPESPWVSVPVDERDLSKGWKDITFAEFANAINHAARWLDKNLPPSTEAFQTFAYTGPRDLRYPILAVAAGKLGKVMIVPSSFATPEAQLRILSAKSCRLYVRPDSVADAVQEIIGNDSNIQTVAAPGLYQLLNNEPAELVTYDKSWQDGKDDPWLVFHTSGTTGYPKPITYTHKMMAIPDTAAGLEGIRESYTHQYAFRRWYTPLPVLHYVGMLMVTSMAGFIHTVIVLGPSSPPSLHTTQAIIQYGKVEGAMLPPSLIEGLCSTPTGLSSLRNLEFIQYIGAPLSKNTGNKLSSHVRLAPSIGSTEAGGYFVELRNDVEDWEYITFQPKAGAIFEHRYAGLHELIFVRHPKDQSMQSIFLVHPDKDRFETKDLWTEHPDRKGLWKISGRTDDYVYLKCGEGLHASTLEPVIKSHELVKAALIGGHGRASPVLLIELTDNAHVDPKDDTDRLAFIGSLEPYLTRVNALCHPAVRLSKDLILFAKPDKPFKRTIKDTIARAQTLKLYEKEIEDLDPSPRLL